MCPFSEKKVEKSFNQALAGPREQQEALSFKWQGKGFPPPQKNEMFTTDFVFSVHMLF